MPKHGLNYDPTLRFPADRAELERRVVMERIPAVLAWARANRLDRKVLGADDAPIGIVTVGRAHEDTMHALRLLELEQHAQIALYKVAMTWPLESEGLREFARGKRALLVVEEKRSFVEAQIREALYNLPADQRPEISGKTDTSGAPLLSPLMELSPEAVACGMASFLRTAGLNIPDPPVQRLPDRPAGLLRRIPAFCAGCPHGTSTRLPDGSYATAGIGCHFMAQDESDKTRTFTHMGGEGAPFARHGTIHRHAARVRQHGRWHVYTLRHHGDPPGGRVEGPHHLQTAGQRCGGDDRRTTGRRQLHGAAVRRSGCRRRRRAHCRCRR